MHLQCSKFFMDKAHIEFLFGAQMSSFRSFSSKWAQSQFPRTIFQASHCIPNMVLHSKVQYYYIIKALTWTFSDWLKLVFFPTGLAPLILVENFNSSWNQVFCEKLKFFGFSRALNKYYPLLSSLLSI